jgi:sulfate adenylyltransferase subunit 1
MSVVIHLEDDIDISRGDMIIPAGNFHGVTQDITASICWMDSRALKPGGKFLLQHNSRRVKCAVRSLEYRINIQTLEKEEGIESVLLNDIASVKIKTAEPLAVDEYSRNRINGAFILIDENSCATVAAGMIVS